MTINENDRFQQEDEERSFQLFEERLTTQKRRVKTGEIKISKRIVTEHTETSMPLTKEKIVIEIESIYRSETKLDIGEAQVAEDGSMRMAIYEDQAMVCRQVVPYQTVSIRKESITDTVVAQDALRREELDVNVKGNPPIEWVDSVPPMQ